MPPDPSGVHEAPRDATARPPSPTAFRDEVAAYDRNAEVATWAGPRYRLRYRVLGQGPPLIVVPGIASTYRGYAPTLNRLSRRFRTILYDYPGEHPDDGAVLDRITHDDLVDDLLGLVDHLGFPRVSLFGLSFGSTVVLSTLLREPGRSPKAVLQGGFARRGISHAERMALWLGRRIRGTTARLPLRRVVLRMNSKTGFPAEPIDGWDFFLEQNGLTPIASLAHRVDLLSRLDLRPRLPEISDEVLLIHGDGDRIISGRSFDELQAALPRAQAVLMPRVGHQPHFTHAEALAQVIEDWILA